MAVVQQLRISSFRNISSAVIEPGPGINLFTGVNGSGKTSLLESIHLLGLGRSFRTRQVKSAIQCGQPACTLYARLSNHASLGFSRARASSLAELRAYGKPAQSISQLAQLLPLQLFNADTFRLLEGSPSDRRAYIDWGVFHVEHLFYEQWRHYQYALKQRNALLKSGAMHDTITPWTRQLIRAGQAIDNYRHAYLDLLLPEFSRLLGVLLPEYPLTLHYERGWEDNVALSDVLDSGFERDKRQGHTQLGPHRADLRCLLDGQPAIDRLSRGQQKLVVCAMKIAQGLMLSRVRDEHCVYLIDDLPSELDSHSREKLCNVLLDPGAQVFISAIQQKDILPFLPVPESELGLFHVKHGKIE